MATRWAAGASALRQAVFVLRFDDGQRFEIGQSALLGRNPQDDGTGAALIAVRDPSRSLSKTHLRLAVQDSQLSAEDLGSTNGTVLLLPSAPDLVLEAHRPVLVPEGAGLQLGDRRATVAREEA